MEILKLINDLDSKSSIIKRIERLENSTLEFNFKRAIQIYMYSYNGEEFLIILKEGKEIFNFVEIETYSLLNGMKISCLHAKIYRYNKGEYIHLSNIDTIYRYSRNGHGSKILKLLIRYSKENGFKKISGGLLIDNDIHKLYKFYSKNGFDVKKTSFKLELNNV